MSGKVESIRVGLDAPIALGNATSTDIWNLQVTLTDEAGNQGVGVVSTQTVRRESVLKQSGAELGIFVDHELKTLVPAMRLHDYHETLREGAFLPESLNGLMGAVIDLMGKRVGRPAYDLFPQRRIAAFPVCITLTIQSQEETIKDLNTILRLCPGLSLLKIKEGSRVDEDKLAAVTQHLKKFGNKQMKFVFDFNGAYSTGGTLNVDGAATHIARLERIFGQENILVIEEPLNCHTDEQCRAFADLVERFSYANRKWRFFLDESISTVEDVERIHDAHVFFDGANLKTPKSGGALGVLEVAEALAQRRKAFGLGCMFELGPGIAHALHTAYPLMQLGELLFVDVDGDMKITESLGGELHTLPPYRNGSRQPSAERPGLGAALNPELYAAMRKEQRILVSKF